MFALTNAIMHVSLVFMKTLSIIILSLVFQGCAHGWKKSGGNFNKDKVNCQVAATQATGKSIFWYGVFNDCLRGKGWTDD